MLTEPLGGVNVEVVYTACLLIRKCLKYVFLVFAMTPVDPNLKEDKLSKLLSRFVADTEFSAELPLAFLNPF